MNKYNLIDRKNTI